MEPYRRPYFLLFNRITDALEILEREAEDDRLETVKELLRQAQIDAEAAYLEEFE